MLTKQAFNQFKNSAHEWLQRGIDQHINIAVTGLSRSGKTAFITSFINQLLNESDESQLSFFDPVHEGRFIAAKRVPQKDSHLTRFPYEAAMDSLCEEDPTWPKPTKSLSQLRVAVKYYPKKSLLKYVNESATLYIDITDYPGEWLLDLPMLSQTFEEWSEQTLQLLNNEPRAAHANEFLEAVTQLEPLDEVNEDTLAEIAEKYTHLLHTCRNSLGLSVIQPGRFILPADLAGAPILQFFPYTNFANLDVNTYQNATDNTNIGMLRSRFIEYKETVVRRFYKKYFSAFDRQIILADCLTPLNNGEASFADLQQAISLIMQSFSYGKSSLFSRLFSPKIDQLLFAASKADHVTPEQHENLQRLLNQLVHETRKNLNYDNIKMKTLSIASVKSTQAGVALHKGEKIPVIQGSHLEEHKKITLFPGDVPKEIPLSSEWPVMKFNFANFSPINGMAKHKSLPHIRMDQVLQFLLGDKMQ